MTKSCVAVTVRIKPIDKGSHSCGLRELNATTLQVPKQIQNKVVSSDGGREFKVDSILGEDATQEECFQKVASPLIHSLLDGYNGTVLAYGQTGAGKSYTMFGPNEDDYKNRGMCSRAISSVFELVRLRGLKDRATISLSAIECYNETMYDMFIEPDLNQQPKWDGGSKTNQEEPLSRRSKQSTKKEKGNGVEEIGKEEGGRDLWLHEDGDGVTQVKNLSVIEAANEEDALTLLYTAASTRTLSSHAMNARSSRAHFILTIHVAIKPESKGGDGTSSTDTATESAESKDTAGVTTVAKLHLVDLAGSERVERTNSVGLVMREAGFINKSLSFLEQVVMALADGVGKVPSSSHIPYRRSKLTHLLKDSIGGNCRTALVSCVCIEQSQMDQTLQTLKFSERMRCVQNYAIVNRVRNNISNDKVDTVEMFKLKKQIELLKQEIIMHDVVSGLSKYREKKLMLLKKNIAAQNAVEESLSSLSADNHGGVSTSSPLKDHEEKLLEAHGLFGMSEIEACRFKKAVGKWVISKEEDTDHLKRSELPMMHSWQLVEATLHMLKSMILAVVNITDNKSNSSLLEKVVHSITGYNDSNGSDQDVDDTQPSPWPTMKRVSNPIFSNTPTTKPSGQEKVSSPSMVSNQVPRVSPVVSFKEQPQPQSESQSLSKQQQQQQQSSPQQQQRPLSRDRLRRVGSGISISEVDSSPRFLLTNISPLATKTQMLQTTTRPSSSLANPSPSFSKTESEEKERKKLIMEQARKEWELGEGKVYIESFRSLCARERDLKKKGKISALSVNKIKTEIDNLSQTRILSEKDEKTSPQNGVRKSDGKRSLNKKELEMGINKLISINDGSTDLLPPPSISNKQNKESEKEGNNSEVIHPPQSPLNSSNHRLESHNLSVNSSTASTKTLTKKEGLSYQNENDESNDNASNKDKITEKVVSNKRLNIKDLLGLDVQEVSQSLVSTDAETNPKEASMLNATLSTSAKLRLEACYDSTQSSPCSSRPDTASRPDTGCEASAYASSGGDRLFPFSTENITGTKTDQLLQQLKAAKRQYRDAFAALQSVKEELGNVQKEKVLRQKATVSAFESWWFGTLDNT